MHKILIADDDEWIRELVTTVLKNEGFVPFEASNGRDALLKIKQINPDLCIIDIMMPQMDGFELCRALRKYYTDMPILILTAKTIDGAIAFSYPLIFLPFISSAFVPTESMPKVVRAFAQNQPVTSIVNSIRSLLSGEPADSEIWIALVWCMGILILAYVFAVRAYRKHA